MAALVAHHARREDAHQILFLIGGCISAIGVLSVQRSLGFDMKLEQGVRSILPANLVVSSIVSAVAHSTPPFKSYLSQNSTMDSGKSQIDSVGDEKSGLRESIQKGMVGL